MACCFGVIRFCTFLFFCKDRAIEHSGHIRRKKILPMSMTLCCAFCTCAWEYRQLPIMPVQHPMFPEENFQRKDACSEVCSRRGNHMWWWTGLKIQSIKEECKRFPVLLTCISMATVQFALEFARRACEILGHEIMIQILRRCGSRKVCASPANSLNPRFVC